MRAITAFMKLFSPDVTTPFCILGTYDFFGLNHYTSELASYSKSEGQGQQADQDMIVSRDPSWKG